MSSVGATKEAEPRGVRVLRAREGPPIALPASWEARSRFGAWEETTKVSSAEAARPIVSGKGALRAPNRPLRHLPSTTNGRRYRMTPSLFSPTCFPTCPWRLSKHVSPSRAPATTLKASSMISSVKLSSHPLRPKTLTSLHRLLPLRPRPKPRNSRAGAPKLLSKPQLPFLSRRLPTFSPHPKPQPVYLNRPISSHLQ